MPVRRRTRLTQRLTVSGPGVGSGPGNIGAGDGPARDAGDRAVPFAMRKLQLARPGSADELHRFVRHVFGIDVPRAAVQAGSTAPFEYLRRAFFEGQGLRESAGGHLGGGDMVVWANRGGGKTMLGAVATVMDLLFKPGVQVRILGGSLEQGAKMYEHLATLLDRPLLRVALATEPTTRRVVLTNGSRVDLLAGTQRSVRGVRVHKLRVDELEELDTGVWEAAQLTTRSGDCGGFAVRGTIEALSTMHKPHGLMNGLVEGTSGGGSRMVMKWTVMDVIGKCPAELPCEGCLLRDDCRGRAKEASGFWAVDDVLKMRERVSDVAWAAEMMCRRPSMGHSVFPGFEVGRHVRETVVGRDAIMVAGMDFGMRSPFVMLWAFVRGSGWDATIHVVDEYERKDLTVDQHLRAIVDRAARHGWPVPEWIGVDPAGGQRNEQTGMSNIELLRAAGHRPRWRVEQIIPGIERLRRRLDRDTLFIHPRCERLIRAMRSYHFDARNPHNDQPVKDGPDHLCDALRYMVSNLEAGWAVEAGSYW